MHSRTTTKTNTGRNPNPCRNQRRGATAASRIGIHTSIAGDITCVAGIRSKARLQRAADFLRQSAHVAARRFAHRRGRCGAISRAARGIGLGPLVIHANYLINLASSDPVLRMRSIQAFHDEMVRATALGADFLVVHPGSAFGAAPAEAIRAVAQGLRQAARGIRFAGGVRGVGLASADGEGHPRPGGLRVLLENTAGMGSAVGARFEDLRAILDQATGFAPGGLPGHGARVRSRLRDSHRGGARRKPSLTLDRMVGLERVAVVHVNDSKTQFGSRVDRHEHIGRGRSGWKRFAAS